MTNATPSTTEKIEIRFVQLILVPLGEFLLTILPLVVITMVELILGKGWFQLIKSPEWAFGSSVLFGQVIFKLVVSVTKTPVNPKAWEQIGLVVVILVVVGLVPSLVVLSLRLTMGEPSMALIISQSVLFLLSSVVFLFFGSVAHYGLFHAAE
jgi:branched-subunit amino acid ABC-type transport system permease component